MKFKYIVSTFLSTTVVCILARALQLNLMIDEKGFTLTSYRNYSLFVLALLFATCIALAVVGTQTHRCPAHPPKMKLSLAFPAILYGVWVVFDVVHAFFSARVPSWQIVLLAVFGILTGALFILYGMKAFKNIKLPSVLFVLPVLYQMVRALCMFISVSTLALTSGHILMLASECSVLLFMLELGKMMCGLDKEKNYRKILSTGMVAVFFCCVTTVPYIVILLSGKQVVLNESYSSLILTFLAGAFVMCFLFNHFSLTNRQLFRKKKSKQSTDDAEKKSSGTAFFTS